MRKEIKEVFLDIWKLYKNFVHWNLSKILFYLYWIWLGVIWVIPFIIIFLLWWWEISSFFTSLFYSIYILGSFWNTLLILSFIAFSIFYSYSFLLLLKLNDSYLNNKKIAYFKNDFLNIKLFWKYLWLAFLSFFIIFIIPAFISIVLFFLSVFFVWWVEKAILLSLSPKLGFFTIFTFILFILFLVISFYLFYRFIFSFIILIQEKEKKWVFTILKESFKKTKWIKNFLKFSLISFLILLLYFPFSLLTGFTSDTYKDIKNYITYISLDDSHKEWYKAINKSYYEQLEIEYTWVTKEQLYNLENFYSLLNLFFSILKFICINGIFFMVISSIYKRIIDKK